MEGIEFGVLQNIVGENISIFKIYRANKNIFDNS
jgi:hypothetical protein